MSRHFIVIGQVLECERDEYFTAWERVAELEAMLRESLTKTGDGAWHERVHAVLGEPKPPLRKLTGKIPHYQRKQA